MPITSRLMLINRARIIEFSKQHRLLLASGYGPWAGKALSSVMDPIPMQARNVLHLMSIRFCEVQNRMNFL